MALGQRLEIRQGQSLVMTPQLQQAIKLLQLSNIELAEYCEAELEKNPLLERDDNGPDAEREKVQADNPSERADESLAREDFSKVSELDQSTQDNIYDSGEDARPAPQDAGPSSQLTDWSQVKSGGGSFDGDEDGLETALSAASTLKDHMEAQVAIAALTPDDRLIALALIDAIDEAGYVRAELADIAERLGTDVEDVEAVLGVVQGFDPVGVAARDLAECLALQLKAKDRLDPAMAMMRALSSELGAMTRQVVDLKMRIAAQRLGTYLLNLVGEPTATQADFRLPVNKGLLASWLGCRAENLSRAFLTLRVYGVETHGSRVQLHDIPRLRSYAGAALPDSDAISQEIAAGRPPVEKILGDAFRLRSNRPRES